MKFMNEPNKPPPQGYGIVNSGKIEINDYVWDRVDKRWALIFGHLAIIAGQPVPQNGTVAKEL